MEKISSVVTSGVATSAKFLYNSYDSIVNDTITDLNLMSNAEFLQLANFINNLPLENKNIKLPKLVVVGTQSSGKSSLLNGLLGADILPTGNNMVTKCPLHIELLKSTDKSSIELGVYTTTGWDCDEKIDIDYPKISRNNIDWFAVIDDFKDELLKLDSIRPKKKHFDVHLICAALMMLKKYGVGNVRLLEGLMQLNDRRKGVQCPREGTDGITAILEEWTTHKLFDPLGTDGIAFPRQQDFLLYCFEKWMAQENVKKYRRPSEKKTKGRGCRKNIYETFWLTNKTN